MELYPVEVLPFKNGRLINYDEGPEWSNAFSRDEHRHIQPPYS